MQYVFQWSEVSRHSMFQEMCERLAKALWVSGWYLSSIQLRVWRVSSAFTVQKRIWSILTLKSDLWYQHSTHFRRWKTM